MKLATSGTPFKSKIKLSKYIPILVQKDQRSNVVTNIAVEMPISPSFGKHCWTYVTEEVDAQRSGDFQNSQYIM